MTNQTMVPVSTPPKNGFLMEPQSLNEAMQLADMLASSNLVPKSYQGKPADVLVACQWGAEIGLKPLQSLQNIAVINNIPAVWGDALVALVRASGLCEYIQQEWDEKTRTATCKVKRKGEPEEVRTFSYEDANIAGHLNKATYKQNLKRMLSIRARAFALRDVFADVLKGLKVAEEVMDYPEEKDITPAPQPEVKAATKAESVLNKVRSKKQTEVQPEVVINLPPEEPEADYTHDYSLHCDALDNASDLAQWNEAWAAAYQWASDKPTQIQKDIKAQAGAAKKRLSAMTATGGNQ